MTEWYDTIVDDIKNALEAIFAKKSDLSGKVNTSDIKDNLTSTDTDKPLSAKQGKELNDKIGSITDFFNGSGS